MVREMLASLGWFCGWRRGPQVQLEPLRDGFLKEASQQEVSQVNEEAAMTPLVSPVCRTLREFGGSLMSHVHLLKHCKSWSMVTDAFDRNLFSVDSTGTHVGQLTLPPPEWVALTDLALQDLADEPEGENSERLVNLVKSQLERFGIWDEVVTPISFAEFFTSKKVDYQGEEIRVAQYVVWEAVSNSFPMEVGKLDLLDFCSLGTHYYVSHFEEFLVDPSAQRQVKPPKVMVDDSQWAEVCRGLIDRGVCEVWPVDELHHIGGAPLLNGLFAVGKGEFVGSLETQRLIMNLIPTNSIALSIQGDLPTLPMVSGLGGILLEEGETLITSSEDIRCFFYLFAIPKQWKKYMGFNKAVPMGLVPQHLAGRSCVLVARVLPMGFSNSVAIAQHSWPPQMWEVGVPSLGVGSSDGTEQ